MARPRYYKGYVREKDETLAGELFLGRRAPTKTGIAQPREYSGARERQANEALRRLLMYSAQQPLPTALMGALVDALDPEGVGDRQLVFEFRKRGRRPNPAGDHQIALHIAEKLKAGWKKEAAIEDAATAYGLSRSVVFEAWQRALKGAKSTPPS